MVYKRGFYIAGNYYTPDENITTICNPYDNSPISSIHMATEKERETAVNLAFNSFDKIASMSRSERISTLQGLREGIESRQDEIAVSISLEVGKPIKLSRIEVSRALEVIDITLHELKKPQWEYFPLDFQKGSDGRYAIVQNFPIGVVLGISPFNFPLNLMMHKLAPAIASGCPYIHKPATKGTTTALIISEILNQLPTTPGQVSIIPMSSNIVEPLIQDERIKFITFTGSADVGWSIKRKAQKARVSLELGGNAACIVESDANIEKAVERCVMGGFSYQGQICISLQRLYIHEKIYDEFMNNFIKQTEKLVIGDPLKEETDIGPMISLKDAERVIEWIDEALYFGGRLLTGGTREGSMVKPTIIENAPDTCRAMKDEIFGPVVMVKKYNNFDEALKEVNNSRYGLQAGIFTRDIEKIHKAYQALHVGGIIINDVPTYRHDVMPYGGVKDSGIGREGPKYAIQEMTETKVMVVNIP